MNNLPDKLSRVVIQPTEWTLNNTVLRQFYSNLGGSNDRSLCIVSQQEDGHLLHLGPSSLAYTVDAFLVIWNQMFAYAFPPNCLILKVLEHMKQGHCQVILIAPQWPRRHWYTDLLQLCIAIPIKLPIMHNLLSQPNMIIYPPDPECMVAINRQLFANGFSQEVRNLFTHLGEQALKKSILINSSSSVVGVVRSKLIHIQHL